MIGKDLVYQLYYPSCSRHSFTNSRFQLLMFLTFRSLTSPQECVHIIGSVRCKKPGGWQPQCLETGRGMSACVSRELAEEERQKADRLNHERKDNGVGGKRQRGKRTRKEKDNGGKGKERGTRMRNNLCMRGSE